MQPLCLRANRLLYEIHASNKITPSQALIWHSYNKWHELPAEECFTYAQISSDSCVDQWASFSAYCSNKYEDVCAPEFDRFRQALEDGVSDPDTHLHLLRKYQPLGLMLSDVQSPLEE